MKPNETIDPETCYKKVKAMRNVVLTEEEEKCRNCTLESALNCEHYKSISETQEPTRRGYVAYLITR